MIFIGEPFRPQRDKDWLNLPDISGSFSPNSEIDWPISQFGLSIPEMAFARGGIDAFFATARRRNSVGVRSVAALKARLKVPIAWNPVSRAIVKTGTSGTFSYATTPNLYTTYIAHWGAVSSGQLLVQVAPRLQLLYGGGYFKAQVTGGKSFWHKHVYLQRLSQFGQWVNVAALNLGPNSGRIFHASAYLPRGVSHIRVFLSVNQAGLGLLSAHSGTQTVRK